MNDKHGNNPSQSRTHDQCGAGRICATSKLEQRTNRQAESACQISEVAKC